MTANVRMGRKVGNGAIAKNGGNVDVAAVGYVLRHIVGIIKRSDFRTRPDGAEIAVSPFGPPLII